MKQLFWHPMVIEMESHMQFTIPLKSNLNCIEPLYDELLEAWGSLAPDARDGLPPAAIAVYYNILLDLRDGSLANDPNRP